MADRLAHGGHALAQRRINLPFLARVELDFLRRSGSVVVGGRAGGQRG
ncbi:hypothetical protein [Acidovorax carolinensis]|nr:hypothetical protein [Acidovorax carolinensis]